MLTDACKKEHCLGSTKPTCSLAGCQARKGWKIASTVLKSIDWVHLMAAYSSQAAH